MNTTLPETLDREAEGAEERVVKLMRNISQLSEEACEHARVLRHRLECAHKVRIRQALEIARQYGGLDGADHKTWVVDQMVRRLARDYEAWVAAYSRGEDGPNTHEWREGIAP